MSCLYTLNIYRWFNGTWLCTNHCPLKKYYLKKAIRINNPYCKTILTYWSGICTLVPNIWFLWIAFLLQAWVLSGFWAWLRKSVAAELLRWIWVCYIPSNKGEQTEHSPNRKCWLFHLFSPRLNDIIKSWCFPTRHILHAFSTILWRELISDSQADLWTHFQTKCLSFCSI